MDKAWNFFLFCMGRDSSINRNEPIKHNPTNTLYYGVQYSKNCNPTNLWKTYFTSSEYVSSLIKEYGKDSFSYEIRKTFTGTLPIIFTNSPTTITITDNLGKIIFVEKNNNETQHFNLPINCQTWSSGVYFININAGSKILTQKFVKI